MPQIVITGDDGSKFRFPEGTPQAEIQSALDAHYGKKAPTEDAPDDSDEAIKEKVRGELATEKARSKNDPLAVSRGGGLPRRVVQGATFNTADEILAGAMTIPEMIARGLKERRFVGPVEAYKHAKAREDLTLEEMREEQGVLGHVAEIGGSVGSGAGLARSGFTLLRNPGAASSAAKVGAGLAEGAGYGAVSGFADGEDIEDRMKKGAVGAVVGGAVGGAIPAAAAVGKTVVAPVVSRLRPEATSRNAAAKAILESGRSSDEIERGLAQANADGQGAEWTLADELGNPGQRALSTVARSPGEGRTRTVEFLERRQAGQGSRINDAIAEGLVAPETARRSVERQTARRTTESNANYARARGSAEAVDVGPAVAAADDFLRAGRSRPEGVRDDSVRGTVQRARDYLANDADEMIDNFDDALAAKIELDKMMEEGGTIAHHLRPVRDALDEQLAQASPDYAAARNNHRQRSLEIEAVETGQTAAQRGRADDNIRDFRGMSDGEQQSFRTGYADKLSEKVESGAHGVNKARPFTSLKMQRELPAIAPMRTGPQMTRRLGRENTMFETRAVATGGSKTADNLADAEGLMQDPGFILNLMRGQFGTAAASAARGLVNEGVGMTPTVRSRLAEILLQTADSNPAVRREVAEAARRLDRNSQLARNLLRGASAGTGNDTQKRVAK